jgi:hypothetical protein
MNRFTSFCVVVFSLVSLAVHAAVITVNSTDDTTTPPPGQTNLWRAISLLQNGDTIQFDIPGAGPHYLPTPPGGYPLITNNNVTIDGFSQPGSVPNSNPILAANNAQLKIVLASTNNNFTSMDYNSGTNSQAGFGDSEFALLGILRATNVQLRGLSLLGGSVGGLSSRFGVAIARDRHVGATGVHVNGCWIGVDPDGTTVQDFDDAIHASSHRYEAGYRFRGTNAGCVFDVTLNNRDPLNRESDRELIDIFRATNTCPELPNQPSIVASSLRYVHSNHIVGVKAGSLNPRSEFNVIVGGTIPIIMEGQGFRISGNFLGIMPDGVTQYLVPLKQPGRFAEAFIEIGRGASDVVIGVDGDGINDADERNVIAGVVTDGSHGSINRGGYRHIIELYSASGAPGNDRQRVRVAGNYVGIGVDGVTRFTNGVPILNGSASGGTHYWIGSDFDGVSDALEGNVFYGNYPPGFYYSTTYTNSTGSGSGSHGFMDEPSDAAGGYSTRGNTIVNNYPYPFNPRRGNSFANITNYINKALASPTANFQAMYPLISSSSTTARLVGTVPAGNATYPWTIIDVYLPDPEGLTNGLVVPDPFLTNGWVHGKTYLGSFTDNSSLDLDPAAGSFAFNTCALGLSLGTQITISANYSKDPPGTHNARVLTSLFSPPATVLTGVTITSVSRSGNIVTINWCGGVAPYTLQRRLVITDAWTDIQTGINTTSTTDTTTSTNAFYRVVGRSN